MIAEKEPFIHLHTLSQNGTSIYEVTEHSYHLALNMSNFRPEYFDLALKSSIIYRYGGLMVDWEFQERFFIK
jgi:hypothetical protein